CADIVDAARGDGQAIGAEGAAEGDLRRAARAEVGVSTAAYLEVGGGEGRAHGRRMRCGGGQCESDRRGGREQGAIEAHGSLPFQRLEAARTPVECSADRISPKSMFED